MVSVRQNQPSPLAKVFFLHLSTEKWGLSRFAHAETVFSVRVEMRLNFCCYQTSGVRALTLVLGSSMWCILQRLTYRPENLPITAVILC